MYLIEYKLGDDTIKKFIGTTEILEKFMQDNPQYEYIKIIEEISDEKLLGQPKVKKKRISNGKLQRND